MCAIAGYVGIALSEDAPAEMLASMAHRGPDGAGTVYMPDAVLLHTRLAIIDPEGGAQPMQLEIGDEQYTIVYNGELYNTEELRQELVGPFRGHSDTEVVLHAYARWGEACLEKLNGIFAFAVWERKTHRLFLARDRIGVKPLFYTCNGNGIVFASEIKTLLASGAVQAELDREGAMQLLLLGPGRIPGSGVLHNIREVEPGCCGYFENGRLRLRRYWKLRDAEHKDSFEETAEKVRFLVTDSIRRQMVSDVPIGTFLSGGLDSSIISAVCAEEMRSRGKQLKTFSVDYQNNDLFFRPGKFQPNTDSSYISIMQEAINSDHHSTVLSAEELVSVLEKATVARDLPGMADVDFSLYAFCRDIRREVKTALSGECADEIFGGYPWYRDPEIREQAGFPWAQTTLQRAELAAGGLCDANDAKEFTMDAYLQTCRESDILPGTSALERRMKEMVNLNFRWFMQTLLDRKDRMSMSCGLEVRVPFCDYRIAEYLYTVPWEYKDWQGREKGLLRYAMRGLLPEQILLRKKSPYPKTFDPRYEELVSGLLAEVIRREDAPLFALIDREQLICFLRQDIPWPWYGQLMRRPQTIAYFLQLNYWLEHYAVNLCW